MFRNVFMKFYKMQPFHRSRPRIIFYAASLVAQPNSAASIRSGYLIRSFRQSNLDIVVWTHRAKEKNTSKVSEYKELNSLLPDNKQSFLSRFASELKIGFELCGLIFSHQLKSIFSSTAEKRIYLISSPPYISCLMAALTCRFVGAKYVLDIRDLYPEAYFHQGLISENGLLGRFQVNLAKVFYQGALRIFAATEGLCERILEYSIKPSNVTLVRNGFDENVFNVKDSETGPFTCVFHGNLGLMQNVQLLLDVAQAVYAIEPAVKFIVIGSGPKAKLLQEGLPSNMKFLGEISYNEIPTYLNQAHIGLSFRNDGMIGETALPVKNFEYIGSGIPVISTPTGEAGRLLQKYGIGYQFGNHQLSEISQLIVSLAKDRTMYQQVRDKILLCREEFSRKSAANIMVKELKVLLDE